MSDLDTPMPDEAPSKTENGKSEKVEDLNLAVNLNGSETDKKKKPSKAANNGDDHKMNGETDDDLNSSR